MATDAKPAKQAAGDVNFVDKPIGAISSLFEGKPSIRLLWRQGWKYLRIFPALAGLFVALSLISSVIMIVAPLLFGKIINGITAGNQSGLIFSYVLWLACAVGGIGLGFGIRYVESSLDVNMANAIRERLFERIIRQQPGFFHANETGRLTLVVNQMGVEAQMTFRQILLDPFFEAFSFLLSVSGLVYSFSQLQRGGGSSMLWGAVAVVFFLALLSPLAMGRLGNRLQVGSARVMELNMAIASLVNGSLKSPEEVQAFNAEDYFVGKLRRTLDDIRKARIRQAVTVEGINTINSLPTILITVLFVGVALIMVISHPESRVRAGYLISILMLAPQILGPIQAVSRFMILLRNSWPSVATVLSVLNQPVADSPVATPTNLGNIGPTLEARDLVFHYRPDLPFVFDGVSFTAPAGKITGLVAKMGQGKTTFFRIALGFYRPDRGQILLGGRPVNEFPLAELRQYAGMLSQFPAFFHDSLRDNLRVAKPDASDDELHMLCRQTGIWPILQEKAGDAQDQPCLPDPLDRPFGAGLMLSGGQKKLLALTRCLLRSPTFLFLDEPTSGMDNLEKFGLIEQLRSACQGKTVMVVDHDIPWLLRFCDYFIVLDGGHVVQQGTGPELLTAEGLFKEIFTAQNGLSGASIRAEA